MVRRSHLLSKYAGNLKLIRSNDNNNESAKFLGRMSYATKIKICVISFIIYLTKTALIASEIFILYAVMRASVRYLRYVTILTHHRHENRI